MHTDMNGIGFKQFNSSKKFTLDLLCGIINLVIKMKTKINNIWLTIKQMKKIICTKDFWKYVASMEWLIKK